MTSSHSFDQAVLIGRFQPFHLGHAALLTRALAVAPRVAVILGSALGARNTRNPFTWLERAAMIAATLEPGDRARVRFLPVRDYYDDARWAGAVRRAVRGQEEREPRTVLVGHRKDASSAYLDLFPGWTGLEAGAQGDCDAIEVRRLFYEGDSAKALASLPAALQGTFTQWLRSADYARIREEHLAILASRKTWGVGPFVTLDAVVEACGHVLLVRRGHNPGKGLLAIPGGFLELEERLLAGARRELQEETGLDLSQAPEAVAVFDHPDRSQRGRTITHAYHFRLSVPELPPVAGGDDAAAAEWVPLSGLMALEDQFFDDHFHILDHFLSICPEPPQP